MDPLIILTYLAVVLMIGVLCSIVAKALRIPTSLLLILMGMILGSLSYSGSSLIQVDDTFIIGIGTLALIMLAFDSSSRLKFRENKSEALASAKIIKMFLLLSIVIISFFTAGLLFGGINLGSVVFSILFSIMAVETDLGSVLTMFREYAKDKASKIITLLETEANLNTPVVIILPFLVLELISSINFNSENVQYLLLNSIPDFVMLLLTSVGVGIIVGLITLKFLRDRYSPQFSPVAVIAACLVGYLLSARIGGDGILAVATMGLIFGNVYVKGKEQLEEFSMMFSKAIEIIIFVMVGIIIRVPLTLDFLIRSLFLFAVLFLIRMVAVSAVLKKQGYSSREITFISLNMPKGITIATVVLVLSTYRYADITITLQLMVMIMLYSLITSTIADAKARKILGHELVSSKDKPVNAEKIYTSEFSMTPEKTGAAIKSAVERKKKTAVKRKQNRKKTATRSPSKKAQKKGKSTKKNAIKKGQKKKKR